MSSNAASYLLLEFWMTAKNGRKVFLSIILSALSLLLYQSWQKYRFGSNVSFGLIFILDSTKQLQFLSYKYEWTYPFGAPSLMLSLWTNDVHLLSFSAIVPYFIKFGLFLYLDFHRLSIQVLRLVEKFIIINAITDSCLFFGSFPPIRYD